MHQLTDPTARTTLCGIPALQGPVTHDPALVTCRSCRSAAAVAEYLWGMPLTGATP